MNSLTDNEFAEFIELEETIEAGLKIYFKVGAALLTIREKRLYRQDYTSFEAYCIDRWSMGRSYANKLIAASELIGYMGTTVPVPANEAQARPLTTLDPEHAVTVWKVVKDTAPDGIVTSEHVKSVVNVFKELVTTGAIDDGTGEQIKVSQIIDAVITEETYERMMRQKGHIATAKGLIREKIMEFEGIVHNEMDDSYLELITPKASFKPLRRHDTYQFVVYRVTGKDVQS